MQGMLRSSCSKEQLRAQGSLRRASASKHECLGQEQGSAVRRPHAWTTLSSCWIRQGAAGKVALKPSWQVCCGLEL